MNKKSNIDEIREIERESRMNEKIDEIREQVEARKAETARRIGAQGKEKKTEITSKQVQDCLQANEYGDGALFAELNRGKLVYNKSAGEWLFWTGHHWKLDIMGVAEIAVEKTVVTIYLDEVRRIGSQIATAIGKEEKDLIDRLQNLQKEIFKRVKKLRTDRGRANCLKFAHTCENSIAIDGASMDKNPWLLACKNGVIDLRTGELGSGNPDDFILKSSPIEFTGLDTPAPTFERFLIEILQDRQTIIGFVQRLFGYSSTGCFTERVMPIYSGHGWNGKSTLCEIIMHIMGDYAAPIPSEMLLDQGRVKNSSAPTPDIMGLRGLRMCFASEIDEGRRFSTGRVKLLTGSDTLEGRSPHDKHSIKFLPTHKLFLISNALPKAPVDDFAFWERVAHIRFELAFVDRKPQAENERPRDKHLPEKLKQESSGILAWLVRGCLEWQRIGLAAPPEIQKETAKYKRSLDHLSDFIDECCVLEPDLKTPAKDLFKAFEQWWEDNVSNRTPAQKTFGTWMGYRFKKDRTGPRGSYVYYDIGLLNSFE